MDLPCQCDSLDAANDGDVGLLGEKEGIEGEEERGAADGGRAGLISEISWEGVLSVSGLHGLVENTWEM